MPTREAGELAFGMRVAPFKSKCCPAPSRRLSKRSTRRASSASRACHCVWAIQSGRFLYAQGKLTPSRRLAGYPQSSSATSNGSAQCQQGIDCDECLRYSSRNSASVVVARGAVVTRTAAECVVEFLTFSGDSGKSVSEFKTFSRSEWERAFAWLDVAGLAFYFLQQLKTTNTVDRVPSWILSRLEENFEANRQRVDYMSRRFAVLNRKFSDAGVRYLALKGHSLVPQFCPDPLLRYQGDFDYLVDDQSLAAAQQVLLDAGYRSKHSPSSQEFVFVLQEMGYPSRRADQYYARTPHGVELHLDIWDSDLDGIPLIPKLFSVERANVHHSNGFAFPALTDEDAFLLQVLHTCHHLFSQWVRMSCLLEIGYFLEHRVSDVELWNRIEHRVGDNWVLREFVVIVTELAAKLFAAPVPELVRDWGLAIRPGTRIWIENYARYWALGEMPIHQFSLFPRAKLVRFLHQQYRTDAAVPKSSTRDRVLPPSRLSRIASSVTSNPSVVLSPAWWRRHLLIQRCFFHVLADLRYLLEMPRWHWLNRGPAYSSAPERESRDRRLAINPEGKTGASDLELNRGGADRRVLVQRDS